MLRIETVSHDLLQLGRQVTNAKGLTDFRLVGGTAIALQLGHRKSVDLDFFSNQRIDLQVLRRRVNELFPHSVFFVSPDHLTGEVNGVKVEFYQDWHIPFKNQAVESDGFRLANLMDLAAFKLSAITARREKKDYIDLYFLFQSLGIEPVIEHFVDYEPLMSKKSILFALTEVVEAQRNQSIMPDMLEPFTWKVAQAKMIEASEKAIVLLKNR